ncbi:globin domain-containing protein [Gracilibacillus alcaliphilus]|uniref:globin domain-containing protein n=1 Tax=Gracilibacillus alcaliphilus TaxID=1401441 RepID=UPI0019572AB5|nr:globin [Gracilibacillus alcaliphilus]MBM7675473.1 hemoglobin [Gracilibacillus alcaliphilus]
MKDTTSSLYEAIGGEETIKKLVEAFYERVAKHPDLIPIFPNDFTEVARKQTQFLTQFFGGPPLYIQEHGHPMMRKRHLRFPITPTRRDAWLSCMEEALEVAEIPEPYRSAMFDRLTLTANHMMNTPEQKGESL